MTLLIACLLIHMMGLSPWFYALAALIWIIHIVYHGDES